MSPQVMEEVDRIIDKYRGERKALISLLQDIQEKYHYLSKDVLLHIRDRVKVPLTQIYGVATFYNAFSLQPRGRHLIQICMGTACHVKGAGRLLEKLERDLKIKSGQTTKDFRFSLESVYCLGCCSLAPVVRVNEDTYGRVRQDELTEILERYEQKNYQFKEP